VSSEGVEGKDDEKKKQKNSSH